jgi:hypothetical protein
MCGCLSASSAAGHVRLFPAPLHRTGSQDDPLNRSIPGPRPELCRVLLRADIDPQANAVLAPKILLGVGVPGI